MTTAVITSNPENYLCINLQQALFSVNNYNCRHTRGKSVNGSEIDIKPKTCDIRTWEKYLFLNIFSANLSHRFISASKPAALKSFDWCLSHFRASFYIIYHLPKSLREFLEPVVNRFTRQTLPSLYRKYFFISILCSESSCTQKTHNGTLISVSILLKHGHHLDYWNYPLHMRMGVCYLDCHESVLCCYLVIHIENFFLPLQLFYFNLWPIYCISFIYLQKLASKPVGYAK
jgi:hypothetical protein